MPNNKGRVFLRKLAKHPAENEGRGMTNAQNKVIDEYFKVKRAIDMTYLQIAFSNLEAVCHGKDCSDCLLEPNDADPVCAYVALKDRLEMLREQETTK